MNDMPVDLAVLEEKKQEAESARQSCITQFEALQHKLNALKEEINQITGEKATVDRQLADFQQLRTVAMNQVELALTNRTRAEQGKNHYTAKLTEGSNQLYELQAVCDTTEAELTE